MQDTDAAARITGYHKEIAGLREKIRAEQRAIEPEPVRDYAFQTKDGPVKLSELFGARDTLFVIHNMGKSCPACTMWADGFNGILDHLESRAAFVVSSPDSPQTQQEFAGSRGWKFRMVSHEGTSFADDMGYRAPDYFLPGLSVFRMRDGEILRVGNSHFGPHDDFCPTWHFLDLTPEGVDGWQPKFAYA